MMRLITYSMVLLGVMHDSTVRAAAQARASSYKKSSYSASAEDHQKFAQDTRPVNNNNPGIVLAPGYAKLRDVNAPRTSPIILDAQKHGLVPVVTLTVFGKPGAKKMPPSMLNYLWNSITRNINNENSPKYVLSMPHLINLLSAFRKKRDCDPKSAKKASSKCPRGFFMVELKKSATSGEKGAGKTKSSSKQGHGPKSRGTTRQTNAPNEYHKRSTNEPKQKKAEKQRKEKEDTESEYAAIDEGSEYDEGDEYDEDDEYYGDSDYDDHLSSSESSSSYDDHDKPASKKESKK